MAITKPGRKDKKADQFISDAPDAMPSRGVKKGKRQQISLTIAPSLLEQLDALADQLGQSRAAVINMAIYQAVNSGLTTRGADRD